MSFRKSAIMLSFAAAMSLLNTTTFAVDMSSSQIIKTTGKVAVKKTNNPEFKKLNSNLKLAGALKNLNGGDKVRTYNNSTADLALKDTCILMVKEQSIFEVPQVLNQQDLKTLVAQQGSVLFKVAKGSNFQVQTADVICGVKGTMFSVTALNNDLNTILETPGLQLGYQTDPKIQNLPVEILVYEGEVEVTDKSSKEKVSLKPGQGIRTSKLSKGLKNILSFNPEKTLTELWGSDSISLLKSTNLLNLNWKGSLNNYSKYATYASILTDGKKIENEATGILINEINKGTGFGLSKSDFDYKKYKLNLPINSNFNSEKQFNMNFGEVYLGNNTFVACKASNGSSVLVAEPIENRYGLNGVLISQGNGLVKMDTFNENLRITNELMANIYESGENIITALRNTNPNLCWREPGSLNNLQRVPTGDVAYVYNRNTSKGYWAQAPHGIIPQELTGFKFSSIISEEQKKKSIDKQNEQKKVNTLKKIINKKSGKFGKFF